MVQRMTNVIYIGYDPAEKKPYSVCLDSLYRVTDIPIRTLMKHHLSMYRRDRYYPDEPKSTEFTFTRFLVPYLSNFSGFSLFCDSDFLFLRDPSILFETASRFPETPLHVVKHPPYIPYTPVKMNDKPQHSQPRKNWCSLMLFNNSHPKIREVFSLLNVNTRQNGKEFHTLADFSDDEIGSIPLEWNCLDGYYHLENPAAIHYTDGGPWHGIHDTQYSDLWSIAYEKTR